MQGADNIVLDPVTGLRVVEASRAHVEVDSYGNEIKEESKVDALKASTKEERLRRTFEAIDEDESGMPAGPFILANASSTNDRSNFVVLETLWPQGSSSAKNSAS